MTARRIIPCLDVKDGRVVNTLGNYATYLGHKAEEEASAAASAAKFDKTAAWLG